MTMTRESARDETVKEGRVKGLFRVKGKTWGRRGRDLEETERDRETLESIEGVKVKI